MARPDILLVMCDQLSGSVPSCYGGPVPTPNIDRLAAEGVRFTHMFCPTPFCSPTRASMITGLYPHAHGITYNVNRRDYPAIPTPETEQGILASDVTTEKLLHAAGYNTHHYGKWHLLDDDLPYYPDMFREHAQYAEIMSSRFDEVRQLDRERWMDWYGWALPATQSEALSDAVSALPPDWGARHHRDFVAKMGRLELPTELTFDYMTASKAVEALSALDERPFMITCSLNYPHGPFVAPSPYYDMFDPDDIALLENRHHRAPRYDSQWARQVVVDLGEAGLREFLRCYYATTALMDAQVGRVLDALERSGRAENTIVLFTADHGDMCGGHDMMLKATDAFYDELVRVPFILRWPAELGPATSEVIGNLTDTMPTLLDLVGHPIPVHVQGRSLVPFLPGQGSTADRPMYTYCERLPVNAEKRRVSPDLTRGSYMVRGQEWKYCRYADGKEMLFNLGADPGEMVDLGDRPEHAPSKERLRRELDDWLDKTGCSVP